MKIIRKNKSYVDCGIVAAHNVASWCNLPKSYREVEKLAKSCGYNEERGIYLFQFANLIKKMGVPAKRVWPRSLGQLESKLNSGKLFILLYTPAGEGIGHVVTAFLDHNGDITLINPEADRRSWYTLTSDLVSNGAKDFQVYEVPSRETFA